jgi:hypothetical protein
MAIKKIKKAKYIALIVASLLFITFIIFLVNGYSLQQRRIGNTNFYLMETEGSDMIYVYYRWQTSQGDIFYEGVNGNQVYDIYWNAKYLLLMCHKMGGKQQLPDTVYYIIAQDVPSSTNKTPWSVMKFESNQEFYDAMVTLGISLSEMEYTDASL